MKHRTQILFDPPQYDFLKSVSRQEGLSLGEVLRRFVEEKRQAFFGRRRDPLAKLIGSLKDKECTSGTFKDYLYGKRRD